ncbi:MAG: hypothetical protein HYT87_15790 [Nitrospirae bacterium]|nr:hypothetical protein [Nitrospirota bacterium]
MNISQFLVPGSWILAALGLSCEKGESLTSAPITCTPAYTASAIPEAPSMAAGGVDCAKLFDPVVLGSMKQDAKVRVFALGRRVNVEEGESEASYAAVIDCMMKRSSDYFRKDIPNLVVFEEYTGLPLVFVGDEGARARRQTSLFIAAAQFADSGDVKVIVHKLASHGWKSFTRTFAYAAQKYGVPVMATTLVPMFDAATLAVSASDTRVTNATLFFDTQGRIVYRWDKVNLVPFEQTIEVTPGALGDVGACDYAGYRYGIGISLDAFIPAYLKHLNDLGVQVLVQPDANDSSWTSIGGAGYWQPEEWLGSVLYSMQDAYPSLIYNVNPMMTGRFMDEVFDGQTAITAKSDPRIRRDINYVGNRPLAEYPLGVRPGQPNMGPFPSGGFLVMGPWIINDPAFPAICPTGDSVCLGLDRVLDAPENLSGLSRAEGPDRLNEVQRKLMEFGEKRETFSLPFLESLVFADL